MMRQTTIALGALLAVTIASLATAPGQALLGLRHADRAQPVTVIKDAPPKHVVPPPPALRPPLHPAASSRPAASPAPQAQGVPSLGQVFTKLLSLPQIISDRIRHPGDDH